MKKLYDSAYLDTLQVFFDRTKKRSYELLNAAPGHVLVDIGSGNGDDAIALARSGATVIGVDHDQLYVDIANAKDKPDNVSFVCGEAGDLPLATASVDKVHFERVFQHIPDHHAAIKEVHRILKPGGQLQVTDSDFLSISLFLPDTDLERKIAEHIAIDMVPNAWKVRRLPELFGNNGFNVRSVEVNNYIIDSFGFANYIVMLDKNVTLLAEKGRITPAQQELWERHKQGNFNMSFNVLLIDAERL